MGDIVDINSKLNKGKKDKKTILHPVRGVMSAEVPYNVIDVRWYTMGRDGAMRNEPIGVVLVEDWNKRYVWAAMGTGKDPQNIAAWGAHLSKEVAEAMFGYQLLDYKER